MEVPGTTRHGMKLFGQQIICYNATEVEITFAPKFGIEAAEAYSPKKKTKHPNQPTNQPGLRCGMCREENLLTKIGIP